MRYLKFLFLLVSFQFLVAQEMTFQKGVVMDSIPLNDTIPETFSLYLPKDFTTDKKWPVIFIFDNEGRGRTVNQLFRQAAEDQNYLLVASNNIDKDSTLLNNVNVAARLMNRVMNIFPIKTDEIYTAGFSEGAQVASVLPAVFPNIQGVMAIGDIWVNPDFINKSPNFFLIGLVGHEDYRSNYLLENIQLLEKAGLKTAVYKYNDGHEWPNFDIIQNSIGSFTLEALASGKRPANPELVEKIYREELETVEKYFRMRQPYKSYLLLEKMEEKYAAYGKKDELRQKQKEVRKSKLFRTQRREYNSAELQEAELRDQYMYFFNEDVFSANFENLGWWSGQIEELKKLQKGKNEAEAEMAFRLEGYLQALAKNSFSDLKEQNTNIDPLMFTAILQTIFDKDNSQGYINIISLSAQDGDYYTALLYLEDLLKTGFKDMEALYNIPGTLDLKLSEEYNHLIKKYLGKSKFYNI